MPDQDDKRKETSSKMLLQKAILAVKIRNDE